MIVNATLKEDGDIGKLVISLDDMMKVGVTFAANVGKRDIRIIRRGILRAAFRIDDARVFHGLEP